MWDIQHLAVKRDSTFPQFKCGHYAFGIFDLFRTGRESRIDDLDLRRVDSYLPGKAVITSALAVGCTAFRITEIHIHSVNRLNTQRMGCQQGLGTGKFIGLTPGAGWCAWV